MAAHKYWRLNILSNHGAGAITVTELYLYDVEGNLVTTVGSGTASASSTESTATASKAFDANTGTQWQSTAATGWLKWTANTPVDVGTIGIRNYNGNETFFPNSCEMEYSDNDTDWTTYLAFTNPDTLSVTTNFAPPNTGDAAITGPANWIGSVAGYGGGNGALYQPFSFSAYGGASASIEAPGATTAGYSGAVADMIAPVATVAAAGAAGAALTMPSPTLYAVGSSRDNAARLTMPAATLLAAGGASAALTMPAGTLAADGVVTNIGTAALAGPVPTLAATGTAGATGSGSEHMAMPMATLVGYSGAVLSVTIGGATVAASGTTGAVGSAALTMPLFELSAEGTAQNHGSAALVMPSPRTDSTTVAWLTAPAARITAIGTAVVTTTYEGYSVNLTPPTEKTPGYAATHYTNWPFDYVVRYQNSYFGVNSTGLYLLEGSTDFDAEEPTDVAWDMKTGISDMGVPEKKTILSAYLAGRLAPAATVSLHAGETAPAVYAFTTPRGQLAQNHRQKFGRGVKDRYFALQLAGGGTLELDSIEFEVQKLKRRI